MISIYLVAIGSYLPEQMTLPWQIVHRRWRNFHIKIQKMRQEQRQAEAAEHLEVESDSDDDEGATGTDNTIHHEIGSNSSTDEIRIGESAVSPGTARFSLEPQSSGLSSIPGGSSKDYYDEQLSQDGRVDGPVKDPAEEERQQLL